jgi:hypothetical protein
MFSGMVTDQIRLYTTMGLIICLDNMRLTKTYTEVNTAAFIENTAKVNT